MSAPREILRLVDQFEQNLDSYKSGHYNEAQLRSEFLDPFFKALGWDMDNVQGLAEAYKDVVHEDAIRIGGAVKAPDYCFRIGGTRKFFLEAKKPSVVVSEEISAAYQLRRYAWSGKLPLSILSDFEEFAVYDCRVKPNKTDSAAAARVFICRFNDYPEKWEWISSIFSKDAILKGSFDKYAETNKAKRGTAEVDDDILATIEHWRSELARILALRNSRLSQRELNFAVQRIIDRIIFLRICEDRGIETYGRLLALTNGPNIYPRLGEIFEDADGKYNSGLFYFKAEKGRHEPPDEITLGLDVDDKLLRDLLKGLYYPESPYEFTVISSDILGHVYEQFLGKVIRLTAGHHAVVEDKPEVKKAGGVYYTPTYIVDYIVRQTVGKLVEKKTPKQIAKLRVLDPACGSGSFLINAYQFLLDWHRDWYLAHKPESWTKGRNPVLVQTTSGWKLTIAERKRILLDNIYGVDIDPQAVEVTKLSLLLKVLEGESEQTIQPFLRLFQQRALPDLGDNIKCGNSLIGPDFYQQQNLPLMSDDDRLRVNVFDWNAEYPEIMKSGGFDAVIGNPPYVRQETIKEFKNYFQTHYRVYDSIADLFAYFIERSIRMTKEHGLFSYIVSNKFVRAAYGDKLRRFIGSQGVIQQYLDFKDLPVFQGATVYPCILLIEKESKAQRRENNQVVVCNIQTLAFGNLDDYIRGHHFNMSQSTLKDGNWQLHPVNANQLLNKIEIAGRPLSEYCGSEPLRGVLTGLNEVFIITEDKIGAVTNKIKGEQSILLPYLRGRNVKRYSYEHGGEFLIFTDGITDKSHPNVMAYLKEHKIKLEARTDIKNTSKEWYELRPCKYYDLLRKPKIIYASVAQRGTFALDEEGTFVDKTCYFIPTRDKYLLGLLNSSLLFYYFANVAVQRRGGYFEYLTQYVARLPIRQINLSNPSDVTRHDRTVELVEKMLELHKQLSKAKTPHEKEAIQRQIVATDKQIDQLVYQLYGLTPEEIKIVEAA